MDGWMDGFLGLLGIHKNNALVFNFYVLLKVSLLRDCHWHPIHVRSLWALM